MLDRPSNVAGRTEFDVDRKALRHFDILSHMLFDFHGRPLGAVERLNPNYVQRPPGVRRHGAPRLVEFRINRQTGEWGCRGYQSGGAQGVGAISIVEYLGECDRKTAFEFVKDLTDRIVELAA